MGLSPTSKEDLCICRGEFHLHPRPNWARSNTEEITAPEFTFLKEAFCLFHTIRYKRGESGFYRTGFQTSTSCQGKRLIFREPAKVKGEEVG